jgi:hypothetical protein
MSAILADKRLYQAIAVIDALPSERQRELSGGAGFAGLAEAHALRPGEAEVVLIHGRNHHTVPSALRAIKFKDDQPVRS